MKAAALLSFSLLCFSCSQQTDKIDLSGSWTFSTDSMPEFMDANEFMDYRFARYTTLDGKSYDGASRKGLATY